MSEEIISDSPCNNAECDCTVAKTADDFRKELSSAMAAESLAEDSIERLKGMLSQVDTALNEERGNLHAARLKREAAFIAYAAAVVQASKE